MWKHETIGILDDPHEKDDDLAMREFESGIRFDVGRYHVSWPWKTAHAFLPSKLHLALVRLKSVLKKLKADQRLPGQYREILVEQARFRLIETSPDSVASGQVHYIPHHTRLA